MLRVSAFGHRKRVGLTRARRIIHGGMGGGGVGLGVWGKGRGGGGKGGNVRIVHGLRRCPRMSGGQITFFRRPLDTTALTIISAALLGNGIARNAGFHRGDGGNYRIVRHTCVEHMLQGGRNYAHGLQISTVTRPPSNGSPYS